MTQFDRRSHRARERLEALGRLLPTLWRHMEEQRQEWQAAPGCYVTGAQAGKALALAVRGQRDDALRHILTAGPGSPTAARLLACWRMTQGIYRLDPAVYEYVRDTEQRGDLPAQVLDRLPEWCVYVETPGLKSIGQDVHGAWAALDVSTAGEPLLSIAMDSGDPHAPLRMDTHTIHLAGRLDDMVAEALAPGEAHMAPDYAGTLGAIVNLLLYIAHGADIDGKHGAPGNPAPVRTKRGWRLFARQGMAFWDVGVRMGAALRAADQAEKTDAGGTHAGPRPHVRRAHWHGFWSGPLDPQKGRRRFGLRWLPPIPVNLQGPDALAATVRQVKPMGDQAGAPPL